MRNGPAGAGPFFVVLEPASGSIDGSPPLENPQEHNRDGHREQNVDEPAEGVGRNDPEKPESQENDEDGPEHGGLVVKYHTDIYIEIRLPATEGPPRSGPSLSIRRS